MSDNLEVYYDALREAYLMMRRRVRHEPFRFRNQDDDRWIEAARLLMEGRGDPFSYVKFVFDRYLKTIGDIWVNHLTSPRTINEYFKDREEIIKKLELTVSIMAEGVKVRVTNGWSLEEILEDKRRELSSVFKFALAWSEGRKDLAENFRAAAERAVLFEPELKRILGKWLPPDLKI